MSLPKLVLVDDNPWDAILLRHALRELGSPAELKHFESGSAASAYLRSNPAPDLLISDYRLREQSGLDLALSWRADARFAGITTVLLSGLMPPKDRAIAEQNGFICLQKGACLEGWNRLGDRIVRLLSPSTRPDLQSVA